MSRKIWWTSGKGRLSATMSTASHLQQRNPPLSCRSSAAFWRTHACSAVGGAPLVLLPLQRLYQAPESAAVRVAVAPVRAHHEAKQRRLSRRAGGSAAAGSAHGLELGLMLPWVVRICRAACVDVGGASGAGQDRSKRHDHNHRRRSHRWQARAGRCHLRHVLQSRRITRSRVSTMN
jgi:hypothetical protein